MNNQNTITASTFKESLPNGSTFDMIKVEGGTFDMGSEEQEREQPIHKVSVPDFCIGMLPVTNSQYAVFLNDYKSEKVKSGDNEGQVMVYEHRWGVQQTGDKWQAVKGFEEHPSIRVTWYGAEEYCKWLSQQTGKFYRLPSEAEWEYAARGGNQSSGFRYSGSNKLKEVGWYTVNSLKGTKTVGLKFPNELGICDMSGNVYEWCADHWHKDYQGAPDDGSTWIKGGDSSYRMVRGGSWLNDDVSCRVSYRYWLNASDRFLHIGFRVVRFTL